MHGLRHGCSTPALDRHRAISQARRTVAHATRLSSIPCSVASRLCYTGFSVRIRTHLSPVAPFWHNLCDAQRQQLRGPCPHPASPLKGRRRSTLFPHKVAAFLQRPYACVAFFSTVLKYAPEGDTVAQMLGKSCHGNLLVPTCRRRGNFGAMLISRPGQCPGLRASNAVAVC
jgi:hypothetical protein